VPETVGVLSLQGDFERHLVALDRIGVLGREVRTVADLDECSRLIIPGGESTTLGILLRRCGLDQAIPERARAGMPIWGTCMGLILLAKEVKGSDQWTLGLLDVTVRRNAFGRQVYSFETDLTIRGLERPFHAVFIRAPIVTRLGVGVEPIAEHEGKVVAVRSGKMLGTAFHPELTEDSRVHELFLNL
jgi:5'-phosphate synthase pdxT subunit